MRLSLVTLFISLITKPYVICAPANDIIQNKIHEKGNGKATKPTGSDEFNRETILELISFLKEEKEQIHNKNKINNGDVLEFETDNFDKRRIQKAGRGGKGLVPRWYPKFRQKVEGGRREDNVESTNQTTTTITKNRNKSVVITDGDDSKDLKNLSKHNSMGKHNMRWMANEDGTKNKKSNLMEMSMERKRNFIGSAALPVSFYMAKYQFGKRDTV